MKSRPTLQTSRLILRPFKLADARDVQRLAGAREIAATTLNIAYPYEDGIAEQWISTHQKAFEEGKGVNFAIVEQKTSQLCGAIGLGLDNQGNKAELGYWIGVPYWGRGYCTEAALAVLDYGFEVIGLHRIHASHFTRNPASGRVMQKTGMTYEGCLRQHVKKWDAFEDLAVYGILVTEWRNRRPSNEMRDENK